MKRLVLLVLSLLLASQALAASKELYVYNWSEYMPDSVLEDFTKETGIKVVMSTYDSNEALYAKIKMVDAKGYDLIVPSTDFVSRMRKEGLLQPIDKSKLSNFGNLDTDSGRRMRSALEILDQHEVDFEYEGEMSADSALDPDLRARIFPHSRLQGAANILIFGYTDAANAARNMLRMKADGLEVGPILMGMGNKAHIATPSITARGLLNMAALAGTPVAHYG